MPKHKGGRDPNTLTLKETKFVAEYIKTGNKSEAARRSYDVKNTHSAEVLARNVSRKPRVAQAIQHALTKAGLTPDTIADALKTNMTAGLGVKATAADANRAIDIYLKVTGAYDSKDLESTPKKLLEKLSDKEIKDEVTKRRIQLDAILSDTIDPIPPDS